ncbi:MAG: hypothetical protein XD49_1328 [Caldanaerobacter subterraneus]|uniref:Uncharacterized protein n=1 Tax=Caldanaerobacter subterraneus TaxID=911092 RepID=A0A124FCH0_9THEO|nr:hypothetical protein [Caldanaerobacter subterraneus]KUK08631.1 MAG: hypothetical protein XD49_1328 [Caldanaerobacter subterraneus]HBT49812.1 hypothetical protein [Caldanaerobacter subterraneus]
MRMNFKIIFVILIIALVLNILIIRINDLKVASGRGIVTSFVWDKKLADNVENGIRVEIYGPNYVDRSSKLQTYQIRLSQSIYKNENWIMLSSMKVKVKAPHNKGKGLWVRKSNAKALFFEKYLIGEPFVFGMYNSGEAYWEIDTLFSAPTFYKERNENNDISLEMYMLPIAGIGEYLCEGKVYVEITFYDVLNRMYIKRSCEVPYYVKIGG